MCCWQSHERCDGRHLPQEPRWAILYGFPGPAMNRGGLLGVACVCSSHFSQALSAVGPLETYGKSGSSLQLRRMLDASLPLKQAEMSAECGSAEVQHRRRSGVANAP